MKAIFSSEKYPLERGNNNNVDLLAQQWAKNYVHNFLDADNQETNDTLNLIEVVSKTGREKTARIRSCLRSVSALAWKKTQTLLSTSVKRHPTDPNLINSWEIAPHSNKIYQKVRTVYTVVYVLRFLSEVIRGVRVSKLFEEALIYIQLVSLNQLVTATSANVSAMSAVQKLIPVSTQIAKRIYGRVIGLYPTYRSYTRLVNDLVVSCNWHTGSGNVSGVSRLNISNGDRYLVENKFLN